MQGLAQMQESAQVWESEAQENLQHMDQLKSMLEESAFWQSQSAQSGLEGRQNGHEQQPAPDGECFINTVQDTQLWTELQCA